MLIRKESVSYSQNSLSSTRQALALKLEKLVHTFLHWHQLEPYDHVTSCAVAAHLIITAETDLLTKIQLTSLVNSLFSSRDYF